MKENEANYDAEVALEPSVPKTIICAIENIVYKLHSHPKAIDISLGRHVIVFKLLVINNCEKNII